MACWTLPNLLGSLSLSECSYNPLNLQHSDVSLKVEKCSFMKALYDGHNVFAWLPIGYGKSLLWSIMFLIDFKKGHSFLGTANFQLCNTNFVSFYNSQMLFPLVFQEVSSVVKQLSLQEVDGFGHYYLYVLLKRFHLKTGLPR